MLQGLYGVLLLRDIILFIVIAVGLGTGSAYFAVENADQLEQFRVGAWSAWPNSAGPDANPYTVADQARRGSIPMGSGEGLVFIAQSDDDGTPLDGACQYRIFGSHMPARLWSLSVLTDQGELVENPSQRYSLHSRNVAWYSGQEFEVMTGPDALGGNWLKTTPIGSYRLVLRLYQTPLTSGVGFGEISLPKIAWVSCQ